MLHQQKKREREKRYEKKRRKQNEFDGHKLFEYEIVNAGSINFNQNALAEEDEE